MMPHPDLGLHGEGASLQIPEHKDTGQTEAPSVKDSPDFSWSPCDLQVPQGHWALGVLSQGWEGGEETGAGVSPRLADHKRPANLSCRLSRK